MTRLAVVGASGFVGRTVCTVMRDIGHEVVEIRAPRLRYLGRVTPSGLSEDPAALVDTFAEMLSGVSVVVNAAGLAAPDGTDSQALIGANAVLPKLLGRASMVAGVKRMIHISSAAVQGDRLLDETLHHRPLSNYARSKALGERGINALDGGTSFIILRPASVHGPGRDTTRRVAELARSSLAIVAGDGTRHTPQVHVENLAAVCRFLAEYPGEAPKVVIPPSEGFTTASFLRVMGCGRHPRSIPAAPLRLSIKAGKSGAIGQRGIAGARRLELLTLGQEQTNRPWLVRAGFRCPATYEDWRALALALREGTNR